MLKNVKLANIVFPTYLILLHFIMIKKCELETHLSQFYEMEYKYKHESVVFIMNLFCFLNY